MKKKSQAVKTLSLLALLFPICIFAADREDVDTDATVPETKNQVVVEGNETQFGVNGYILDRYPVVYLSSAEHLLAGVSKSGDEIELEDGSIWKISTYDGNRALDWLASSQIDPVPLVITKNSTWFSNSYFRIRNTKDNSSISANLFRGPFKGGEHSRYITEIDYISGLVRLSDTTHWLIEPSDRTMLLDWIVSEPVIIGQNVEYDSIWNPDFEGMLINVRKTKKSIRAHQY